MSQHLFIDNKATELRIAKTYLEIRQPDRPISTVPFRLLNHITIACDLVISTNVIHKLSNEGISVTLLNGRSKDPASFCYSLSHGNHARRLAQYKFVLDESKCFMAAQQLLERKLYTYIRQIRRFVRLRPTLLDNGNALIAEFNHLKSQIEHQQALPSLLGLEGTAARLYFQFYSKLMPPSMPFESRNKRPPKDPINALLSLTYTLFTSECARALEACGLDPAFGIYHQVAYNRPSAACDLVELFRTQADFFVWRLVAEQKIRPDHFAQQLEACILNKMGKEIFFQTYFAQLDSCRQRFYRYARRIAHVLTALEETEVNYIEEEINEIDCNLL